MKETDDLQLATCILVCMCCLRAQATSLRRWCFLYPVNLLKLTTLKLTVYTSICDTSCKISTLGTFPVTLTVDSHTTGCSQMVSVFCYRVLQWWQTVVMIEKHSPLRRSLSPIQMKHRHFPRNDCSILCSRIIWSDCTLIKTFNYCQRTTHLVLVVEVLEGHWRQWSYWRWRRRMKTRKKLFFACTPGGIVPGVPYRWSSARRGRSCPLRSTEIRRFGWYTRWKRSFVSLAFLQEVC